MSIADRSHPPSAQLVAFSLGRLDDVTSSPLEEHLRACPECCALLAELPGDDPLLSRLQSTSKLGRLPLDSGRHSSTGDRGHLVADRTDAALPLLPGYVILEEVGRGGMGVVYRARQSALNRPVALKMILHSDVATPEQRVRFRMEAELAARVRHPNIVQVYEVGLHEGRPFLALEWVNGGTLADLLKRQRMAPRQAAEFVEVLARTTHAAHVQGVLHRDLKPGNILLQQGERKEEQGEAREHHTVRAEGDSSAFATDYRLLTTNYLPKIADFGLAKHLNAGEALTATGVVVGTAEYMAPEQAVARSHELGPAVDVYGLGACLYEMLTGRPPFRAATPWETLQQVVILDPIPPRRLRSEIPRELELICLKCLAKEPGRRYQSALGLADDLQHFLVGEPVQARPTGRLSRAGKWARRRPALAAFVLLVMMVFTLGFPAVTVLWLRAEHERQGKELEAARAGVARELTENALYAGRMALTMHSYKENDTAAALELLDRYETPSDQAALRGWEWHYLRRLCRADLVPGMLHLKEEQKSIHALEFVGDGSRLVSGAGIVSGAVLADGRTLQDSPGEVRLWDAYSGAVLSRRGDHAGAVWGIAVSQDGKRLVTAGFDGSVLLRDAATLKPLPCALPPPAMVIALALSPDGHKLALSSRTELLVWDLESGKQVWHRPVKMFRNSLSFSPDGQRLAAATLEGLLLCDSATGATIPHKGPTGRVDFVAYSPDRPFLALVRESGSKIEIWDAAATSRQCELVGHTGVVLSLAYGPRGQVASGGEDRTVRLWEDTNLTPARLYRGHMLGVTAVAFHANGLRLASGAKDRTIKIWNTAHPPEGVNFHVTPKNHQGEWLANFAFSADSKQVLSVHVRETAPRLQSWDARTGALASDRYLSLPPGGASIELKGWSRASAFSSGGRRLAAIAGDGKGEVSVWDTATGSKLGAWRPAEQRGLTAGLSPDGELVAFGGWEMLSDGGRIHSEVTVVDIASTQTQARLTAGSTEHFYFPVFSPDGKKLAMGVTQATLEAGQIRPDSPAQVRVYEVATGREILRPEGGFSGQVGAIAFSPDGAWLAASGADGTVHMWDAATGKPRFAPLRSSVALYGLTFSPDGRRLAANGRDGRVRLWDAITGNELLVLSLFGEQGTGHYGYHPRIVFSPDGNLLAANSWDGYLTVWDAAAAPPEGAIATK